MKRGFIQVLIPAIIMVVVCILLVMNVLAPVTNNNLAGNGTCQPGATCAWNQSGYTSAFQVAQTFPIFEVLLVFAVIAVLVMAALKFIG